ncbi:toprim domain-containing protein [Devosia sp. Naph2]|uniref:DUF7146 domain-containing protein n=1 Tax=Devosia polycyclovorans TaxID=3345148 RepID=UPI0035CF94BC
MAAIDSTRQTASDLTVRLAQRAEAVCKYYLSNGVRCGNYWLVGDVKNCPGRSLFVRLTGPESGRGAAGRWSDAATGEFGDLLDVIAHSQGYSAFSEVAHEARRFLSLPQGPNLHSASTGVAPIDKGQKAKKLFDACQPISHSFAETYLRTRGLDGFIDYAALRFHPHAYLRDPTTGHRISRPALVAAVTDAAGTIVGVQRTFLRFDGQDKASIADPRRSMGSIFGHGVRIGWNGYDPKVIAVGEGLETVLSLRTALPKMPMVACLSAGNLGAFVPPPGLRRLYIALDDDRAGHQAASRLADRARNLGVGVHFIWSQCGDANDDLRALGFDAFRASVVSQLLASDRSRFQA